MVLYILFKVIAVATFYNTNVILGSFGKFKVINPGAQIKCH